MIQVCPAILTNSKDEFTRELKEYSQHFEIIDVDINIEDDEFYGDVTVTPIEACQLIKESRVECKFNFHIMANKPEQLMYEIRDNLSAEKINKFFIHQESESDLLNIEGFDKSKLAIAIKADSVLREIDFYNNFLEVQLMTVKTGKQRNPFLPVVLERVVTLKKEGYRGTISVDGSVNIESAKLIKEFPIKRVSVGSYFSKSADVKESLIELEKILNIQKIKTKDKTHFKN